LKTPRYCDSREPQPYPRKPLTALTLQTALVQLLTRRPSQRPAACCAAELLFVVGRLRSPNKPLPAA